MPFAIIAMAINVAFIVHAAKTGRFNPWGYVMLFLPGVGALAYVLVELIPEWMGTWQGQQARRRVVSTLNPEKDYRRWGEEPAYVLGKARAEFGVGRPQAAVATLDDLRARWPDFQSADGHLLYARALAGSGRIDEALDEYRAVSRYFAGAEARVRWALLLESLGRQPEAKAIYTDLLTQMRRAPKYVRKVQAEWIAVAQKQLRA